MTERRNRWRWNAGLVIGLALLSVVVVIAIAAPMLFADAANVMGDRSQRPSGEHLLGTDAAGHDLLLRSLVATRLTLIMTAGAAAISVLGGIALGVSVWGLPPRGREVALRGIDAIVAFPGLLLALVVAAILGAGGSSAVVAIGLSGIPYFARLTANLSAKIAQQEYVATARLMGVSPFTVSVRHMLPNMAEPLLVLAASNFASSLTAISALSFVGLGVQSPQYDWGKLLNEAIPSLLSGKAYEMVGPAALIIVTGLSAILIGDGLAAAANPNARSRRAPKATSHAPLPAVAPSSDALLRVRNLRVSFQGKEIVKGVSFDVARGEIVGIVGESGSGKTLTAMSVAQLLPENLQLTADELALGDIDLRSRAADRDVVHSMSMIYQDPGSTFNPSLKMGQQLTQVLTQHFGMAAGAAKKTMREAFEKVRMTEPDRRLRQYPYELSGGMRQRAMIASALATRPKLIVADEATTALDVTVQADILRELVGLNRELGASVMFISHDIGVVRELCDRVVVMYHGEVMEVLAADDLTVERATHDYTRKLLAATPELAIDWETVGEEHAR